MGFSCSKENSAQTEEITNPPKRPGNKIKISISKSITNKEISEIKMFKSTMISLHNDLRKKYNSPDLLEDKNLNNEADEYADNILSNGPQKNNVYVNGLYGENIIIIKDKEAKKIFYIWAEEEKNYDFTKKKYSKNASHFTQIIWKGTRNIGIGFSHDVVNKIYCIVALYNPPGNTLGEFETNVSK